MLLTATVQFSLDFPFAYDDASEADEVEAVLVEPTHSDEDETFYVERILSGEYDDEQEARESWAEDTFDADMERWMEGDEYGALDAYERTIYGD